MNADKTEENAFVGRPGRSCLMSGRRCVRINAAKLSLESAFIGGP
jgi:hypothetical protein